MIRTAITGTMKIVMIMMINEGAASRRRRPETSEWAKTGFKIKTLTHTHAPSVIGGQHRT